MSARRRTLVAVAASIASVVIAAAFVRVKLDWSDAQPYDGAATELRYVVLATLGGAMAIGGTVASAIWWWRGHR
jgi:type IV secretory pathway VirB2 component (pilin)